LCQEISTKLLGGAAGPPRVRKLDEEGAFARRRSIDRFGTANRSVVRLAVIAE